MGSMKSRPWLLFVLLLILSFYRPCFSIAGDTLSPGYSLSFSKSETLSSQANRQNPLSNPSTSRLYLSEDGNLLLFEGSSKIPVWSTNLTFPRLNLTEAVLREDGNLVLRDRSNTSSIFWESFDHLTDTLLPGAKLGIDKVTGKPQQLISWKNSEDPAPGVFSVGLDPNGSNQIFLEWNRSQIYWSSGVWNANVFHFQLNSSKEIIFNYTFVSSKNESDRYFICSLYNPSNLAKFRLDQTGQIRALVWLTDPSIWNILWSGPRNQSDVYALCGAFGVVQYRENFSSPCECLTGFEPSSMEDTRLNDWSGGCVRKSPLQSYGYNRSGCMIWEEALSNLKQLSDGGGKTGQDIYIKLAAAEHQSTKESSKKWKVWIAVLVPTTGLILCLFICLSRERKPKRIAEKASSNNLLLFDLDTELHAINDNDGMNTNNNLQKREKAAELPLFSYQSVSAATNNFSAVNKLGEGGFGPVYKGKLLRGQEIAVKMLSKRSGQGIEEFRNETILIAKLQHRNLVRILGCCIEQDEKILIYEYMSNQSLDFYLFDPTKKKMLGWETRIRITEGIAQGLLYLHQYSRLRIIHRDLKPSNILLDNEMNPKISDFGMARIVGGNEIQANTNRIVGTYGYMSPEYAVDGLYSIKSDVFSFGVLVLEIISGRKILASITASHLIFLDTLGSCGEMIKQPAFSTGRNTMDTNSSIDSAGNCSKNNITISTMEAR
ncbi:hypothetical protein SLA2020_366520 [Shorea laevis]